MKHILCLILMSFCSLNGFAEDLPDNSIYHIGSTWTNQDKTTVDITQLRGQIQIIAFIYTYCEHSCPIIMERLKQIDKHLVAEHKNDVHFSLFTLDPERDTPEKLKLFAEKHALDENSWSFYQGTPDDVLALAAMVGVRYKPMDNGKGDIAHSNMITLLDKQGRIVHQVKGFGEDLDTVLSLIKGLLAADEVKLQ